MATIVYGHNLRSMIPTTGHREEQYERQKKYYNRGAHNMEVPPAQGLGILYI